MHPLFSRPFNWLLERAPSWEVIEYTMPAPSNIMPVHKWLRFHRLRTAVTMSTAPRSDISKSLTTHLRGFRGVPLTSAEMGTQFPMLAKVVTACEWLSTRFACSVISTAKAGRRQGGGDPTPRRRKRQAAMQQENRNKKEGC